MLIKNKGSKQIKTNSSGHRKIKGANFTGNGKLSSFHYQFIVENRGSTVN